MTALEGRLSLLDNPVGFVDHLESLDEQGVSADQRRELLELVTAQYQRTDELLKPISFAVRIRGFNGRPRGFFKDLDYLENVHIEEPALSPDFGRVEIKVQVGGMDGFKLTPEDEGTHHIEAEFRGNLEDRTKLTGFMIRDTYVSKDEGGAISLVRRGYALETNPLRFRPLAANENF